MEQRLQLLEVQAAQKGQNTPPEIVLEINDLQADIRRIDESMRELDRAFFVQPDLTPTGMYELFISLREETTRALNSTYTEILKIRDIIATQAAKEATEHAQQRRWQRGLVVAVAALVVMVAVAAWWLK